MSVFNNIQGEISKLRNSALKGLFYAPDLELTLKFQFNPSEINIKKDVNYENIEAPQYPTQIITWAGNAQKELSFQLVFETFTVENESPSAVRRSLGTLGIEAILETLTLPSTQTPFKKVFEAGNFVKNALSSFSISGGEGVSVGTLVSSIGNSVANIVSAVASELTTSSETQKMTTYAPPDVYLILGRRWYRGKLRGFDVTERGFNRFMTPRWLETNINFAVLEDGQFAQQQDNQRMRWAKLESALSNLEVQENVLESAAGFAFDVANSNLGLASSSLLEMPMDLGL